MLFIAQGKFVVSGSIVNLCALDVFKAFDKVNHFGLFIKLKERNIPNKVGPTPHLSWSLLYFPKRYWQNKDLKINQQIPNKPQAV